MKVSQLTRRASVTPCDIVEVGKRRDGGTRYWCLRHKADATAKYGRRARRCRYADVPSTPAAEILTLNLDRYPRVALWGAVPPVYDTTRRPLDRGIHVHARLTTGNSKEIDRTYPIVKLVGRKGALPAEGIVISDLEAIYYMTSSVLGHVTRLVRCTYCNEPHLDKDWFSVHAHQRHLCAGCGKTFRDDSRSVGNPVSRVRDLFERHTVPERAKKRIRLRQRDFPGGLQIWGSNPAFLWTSTLAEEEGIHVHAFSASGSQVLDDTYSSVKIDGISLDPLGVRMLMAQNVLPHLKGRVQPIACGSCGAVAFDKAADAYTPRIDRQCPCGARLRGIGKFRKVISNPAVAQFRALEREAPRSPQLHDLRLIAETI